MTILTFNDHVWKMGTCGPCGLVDLVDLWTSGRAKKGSLKMSREKRKKGSLKMSSKKSGQIS